MTGLIEIPFIGARFTSVHQDNNTLFDGRLPRKQRVWSSANAEPQMLEGWFDALYTVRRVEIDILSSDQTSWRCEWEVLLCDGRWQFVVDNDNGANVGRGGTDDEMQFSLDRNAEMYPLKPGWLAERKSVAPIRIEYDPDHVEEQAIIARSLQIKIRGHGWFWVQGVAVWGIKLRDFSGKEREEFKDFMQA